IGVAELRSTSILPTFTLPKYSVASSSTMGAIARQGPHQVAQKSTSTGLSDFKTSASKFASVTSTIPLPAISFLLVVTSRVRRTLPFLETTSGRSRGPDDLKNTILKHESMNTTYECLTHPGPTSYRTTAI